MDRYTGLYQTLLFMTELEQLKQENEILKKQVEYMLMRRKQQIGLARLKAGYDELKVMALKNEHYLMEERIEEYFQHCATEKEIRIRAVKFRIGQINKFRRDNMRFWPCILELQY